MGGETITMLFNDDKNCEPPAIIQDNTFGEYYPFYFFDWRDGVHYILWCRHHAKYVSHESFSEWEKIYGYDKERFNGNLNEFINEELGYVWNIKKLTYKTGTDLYSLSVWKDN